MAMRQEQQLDQDKQQSSASIDKDPGPKITLAEFIAAVYGLDPDKLYYNWFGRLSPLPPQAQELHMLLAKRIQVISRDTFGCTVLFGNEECTNIRIKEINKECKFHICAYLNECNNISINRSQNFLKRRLSRLRIYRKLEHLAIFLLMTIGITISLYVVNFLLRFIGLPSYSFPESLDILCKTGIVSSLVTYIFAWEGFAEIIEQPSKKSKLEHLFNLDEIRLKILSLSTDKTSWNTTCENIFFTAKSHLNQENCKEHILTKLQDEIKLRHSKEEEIRKLSSEIESRKNLLEQAQKKISEIEALNQALTEENAKILSSNLTLKTQNSQLAEQNNVITQKITRLSLTNEELKLKSDNLDNVLEQNRTLKNTITRLEASNPDASSLDTYKKLSYCLLLLYCELLIGNNTPKELQKAKNSKSILTGISAYLDALRSDNIEKFRGLSRSNIFNLTRDLINFSFRDTGIDPRLIHKHYDGSIEFIEKIYKNYHQKH